MVAAVSQPTFPLSSFYIYVTDRCNCACKHCWIVPDASAIREEREHFLSPELFEAAVLEAKPLGLTSVKWTGGEPTIHPDFARLLALQKKHELVGRLETNGIEVTSELAQLMARTGMRHVAVSLDGVEPETHDAIRGVRGAHRRALRGLAHLVEAGFAPQLIMTLMRENVGELEGMLELAPELGAGSVKLNIVQPTLRGADMHSAGETLAVAELIELNRRVEQELRPRSRVPVLLDVPVAFRPLRRLLDGDGCSVCSIKTILGVLADGSYALCGIGANVPELVFGRAGEGQLDAIWMRHPVLLNVREGLPDALKGICERCLMKAACLGSCVAQNYYREHDLFTGFWFCETAEQEGLFPATRLRD